MKIKLICAGLSLITLLAFSQKKQINYGMGYLVGTSRNFKVDKVSQAHENLYYSVGLKLYSLIRFKPDSVYHPVSFLRIGFNSSTKAGLYKIENTPTKIRRGSFGIDVLAPVMVNVSNNLNMYAGLGASAEYLIAQTKDTPKENPFYFNFIGELGLITNYGSYFCINVIGSFGDYPTEAFHLSFGITTWEMRHSFKRIKVLNK